MYPKLPAFTPLVYKMQFFHIHLIKGGFLDRLFIDFMSLNLKIKVNFFFGYKQFLRYYDLFDIFLFKNHISR